MTDNQTETRLNDGDGLDVAHPEDFGFVRGEDGEAQPLRQKIPGMDKAILVTPLVGGAVNEWEDVLESDAADDDRVDEFLETHIVEGVGANGLHDGLPDYLVPGLIQAVKNSSGHEVFQAVESQQAQENLAMVEQMGGVGEEIMGQMMEERMDTVMDEQEQEAEDQAPRAE